MSLPMKRAAAASSRIATMALRQHRPALSVGADYLTSRYLLRQNIASATAAARSFSTFSTTNAQKVPTIYKCRSDLMGPMVQTNYFNHHQQQQQRFKSAMLDHPDPHFESFDAKIFATKVTDANRKAYDKIVQHAEKVLHGHVHDKAGTNLQILDVASGPGEPAASLARAFPDATVISTDLNPDMVDAAKKRLSGFPNAKVEVADIENLAAFDDATFDLVTCSYGLMFAEDPELALYEIHRVLKPGGTLISTVWENLTLERASETLLRAACNGGPTPERLIDPVSLAGPRHLEGLIEKAGMSLVTVDQGEYSFEVEGSGDTSDAFAFVTTPIYPNLADLVISGYPNAFETAKVAFDNIVAKEEWLSIDDEGGLKTKPNRYKLAVARRQYEDNDGKRKIVRKKKAQTMQYPRQPIHSAAPLHASAHQAFDQVLTDAYTRVNNGPWNETVKAVEHILHGQDESKAKILNLGSGVGEPASSLSKRFSQASVVTAADASHDLSSFSNSSFDIVTCAFGLSLLDDPNKAVNEIHRVLKPGGSFVVTVWDSLSVEHMSDEIMAAVMKEKPSPPRPIDYLSLARPHALEKLIEGNKMTLIKLEHEEFPFQLSGLDHQPSDFAFNVATIPIHQNLQELVKNGTNPVAVKEAHDAFNKIVDEGVLVHKDHNGHLFTSANRFKIAIARRQYEDADGVLEK